MKLFRSMKLFGRKIHRVKQRDITDCGAACLASIATHYGKRVPVARIRQHASTDKHGTNVAGMIEAARHLGFTAKGVKGPFESLTKVPKPAIAHVKLKSGLYHFLVIYDVTPRHVVVMDPADGYVHRLSHDDFRAQWTGVLVLLAPDTDFSRSREAAPSLVRFWRLIQPHRTVMLQALLGAAAFTIIGLAPAIYVQKIVDQVIPSGNRNLLNLLSIGMIVLVLIQVFIGLTKSLLTLRTGQKIDAELVLGYHKHLLGLPQRFFDTMRVGEILSRVNDAVKIRFFINDVAVELVVNLFIVVFSFGLMFAYSWRLALMVLAIVPIYTAIFLITNRINRRAQRDVMESAAELESQLVETLNSVSTIKSFGLEPFANLKAETRLVRLLRSVYHSGTNSLFSANSSQVTSRFATMAMLWVGTGFVLSRTITPGELMSFYALMGYLTGPIVSLISMNRTVQDALIAADRLFEILDLDQEASGPHVEVEADLLGDITFHDVGFRYGTRAQVFAALNLKIEAGKMTAIVGESGSGKSTLVGLLQNLYPVNSGQIRIGTYDLRLLDMRSLRRHIGVVPQRLELFTGSILDNIAVGEFEPDVRRVAEICQELGLLEFIQSLPEGFGTPLGENGAGLSGGQRQRLAIARALYRNPQLLIMDEATSALDSISELYVKRVVQRMRSERKTVIIIAHRLSSVIDADRVVVLANGVAVEEGTHASLLRHDGVYHRLWQYQTGGRPLDEAACVEEPQALSA